METRLPVARLIMRAPLCRSLFAIAVIALVGTAGFAQRNRTISGVVLDTSGGTIRSANIEVLIDGHVLRAQANDEGRFVIAVPFSEQSSAVLLVVSGYGFATKRIQLSLVDSPSQIEVRLEPGPITARIEVKATDQTEAGNGETILSHVQIVHSGPLTLDDALRQVPGFSLFRRSGSLTANPTSQGVSLRGVGASGASRAVVLFDGVPLNSPFGSWIYWNRVPRAGIESVSVLNGATSDAYGSGALGGVINIESRQPEHPFLETDLSFGNEATGAAAVVVRTVVHKFGITASTQALRTDGYVLVAKESRGAVDTPAATADASGYLTISHPLHNNGRAFVRANSFGESRRNGTPIQINDTRIWSIDLGLDKRVAALGDISARMYGSREIFNQNFSAVSADRNSESLTNRQRNPSQQFGFAFQWERLMAERHLVIAGVEMRDVRGHSAEITFNAGRTTSHVDAGGQQTTVAVFAQDSIHTHQWLFTFGARLDRWNNRGFSNRLPVTGSATFADFPSQVESSFSPRASISRTFGSGLQLSGSVYHAFRAPTLNELYRPFRVGNVVTNANSNLTAERLTGVEAGLVFHPFSERVTTRVSFFWNQIADPVANVTVSSTSSVITRQRQNLGSIHARGIEATTTFRLTDRLNISAQYLLTDTTVHRFPVNPTLEGLLIPQIPRHQFGFQIAYSKARWTFGAQARAVGTQFDDDQNLLPLNPFFTLDADVSRRVAQRFEVYLAAQNLTGVRYDVGRSPVLTTGPPALLRTGIRMTFR